MKTIQLVDWFSFSGDEVFSITSDGIRRFDLALVTQGCSVIVHQGDAETLVAHGEGPIKTAFGLVGPAQIEFKAFKPSFLTSVLTPDARQGIQIGWADGPSIVQLEPKDPAAVSPEIKAMMDNMYRNQMRREAALRAEFERKLGQAQNPAT